MKILYHNYTNSLSTEPIYMHNALLRCGIQSTLWGGKTSSVYDTFDTQKPDIFITHFKILNGDIIDYLKNNKGCDVIVNVTGATQNQIKLIEKTFKENKIYCPFLMTNEFDPKFKSDLVVAQILPAADIFLIEKRVVKTIDLPEAIIANKFDEHVKNYISKKSVFHLLHVSDGNLDTNFDIKVNAQSLFQLYDMYSSLTLIGDDDLCCSQLFLDLNMTNSFVKIPHAKKGTPMFNAMLLTLFDEVLETAVEEAKAGDENAFRKNMKKQIKEHHTPIDRVYKLMHYLKNADGVNRAIQAKDQIKHILGAM